MKARLWKGPFAGKVVEHNGSDMLVYDGPKSMSRKQKYKWQAEHFKNPQDLTITGATPAFGRYTEYVETLYLVPEFHIDTLTGLRSMNL